jgi:hypothetical protein
MSIESLFRIVDILHESKRHQLISVENFGAPSPGNEDETLMRYLVRKTVTILSLFEEFSLSNFEGVELDEWNKLCKYINQYIEVFNRFGPIMSYDYIIEKLDFLTQFRDQIVMLHEIKILIPTAYEIEIYGYPN